MRYKCPLPPETVAVDTCCYVYDTENERYYLQSRYYDPELGRFLNADALVSTGQGLLGNNMFSYCLNNPVCRIDTGGTDSVEAVDLDGNPVIDEDDIQGGGQFGGRPTAPTNNGNNTGAGIAAALKGYTSHGIHQATTRNGVGVKPSAILDTLRNPNSVKQKVDSMGRIAFVYTGASSVVVLNKDGFW